MFIRKTIAYLFPKFSVLGKDNIIVLDLQSLHKELKEKMLG
jgi:hypothetical protein